ncbi:NADH-quinone oxidoreductase subunit J [Candidatus Pantoea edessiphila]|uniref:NADH-quinone oxidoreductase subunit J n=1 Tax=Candidatus Pantoea edessiphila TaxID=2044610 RepID=A0A2P5SYM2_9GAMM|nr:NADH-quinone oxidoreductase subunit J [Candidatus Pantoea edessiphila]PPI87402.1 NADH-quinone oxidoreductase subunit J [Candidatus Pantoea edessiphila]
MKEFIFYFFSLLAIITTLCAVIHTNPIYMLLYLIVSLLSVACIYFLIGAYFIGALEVIIYTGAIMVLFVFVVMMLNLGKVTKQLEYQWLKSSRWIIPTFVSMLLLAVIISSIINNKTQKISNKIFNVKEIGISLFGHYMILVELISILLLASLIVALHIGRKNNLEKLFGKQ